MPFPGVFPVGLFSGAAPALASVSNAGTAQSTAQTVAWPAVQAGDLAILFDFALSIGSSPAAVTPAGFTNACNLAQANTYRAMTSFRVCDGSETGNITGVNGGLSNKKALLILRGNVPFVSAAAGGAQNGAVASGNPSAINVAASGSTPPSLVIGCYNSTGTIDPRTFSTTKDGEASFHTNSMYIAWKLYLSAPADTTIDMDDEGNDNIVQGFYANLTV